MDKIAKAKQIVAHVEKIQARNASIPQNYPHDERRDYNYTSYAWALNVLNEVR
ncbi:hypothetical protein NF324_002189 [Salmonella enterica]|nr:hypothetical protein [Salmonella enterica]